jgi:hypothetical protein
MGIKDTLSFLLLSFLQHTRPFKDSKTPGRRSCEVCCPLSFHKTIVDGVMCASKDLHDIKDGFPQNPEL